MALSIDHGTRHIELAVVRTAEALQAVEAGGSLGPETGFATAQRAAANHAVLAWSAVGTARSELDEGRNLLRDAKAAADAAAPHATVADALRGALEALTAAQATAPGVRASSSGSPSDAVDDLLGWQPGGQREDGGAPVSPDAPWSSDGSSDASEPSPRWNPSSDTFGDDGGPFV